MAQLSYRGRRGDSPPVFVRSAEKLDAEHQREGERRRRRSVGKLDRYDQREDERVSLKSG